VTAAAAAGGDDDDAERCDELCRQNTMQRVGYNVDVISRGFWHCHCNAPACMLLKCGYAIGAAVFTAR